MSDQTEREWLEGVEAAVADGDPLLAPPERRVASILYAGAAEAYGYPAEARPPCSRCGTGSPAGEPAECDDLLCPLEGDRP